VEIKAFDREARRDRGRRCRPVLLAAKRDQFVVRIGPRKRRHRAVRSAFEFDVIDAPRGGDDEIRAKPAEKGFTKIWVRWFSPLPLVVSPTVQRTVSPAATDVIVSPGCKAMSVMRSGAA